MIVWSGCNRNNTTVPVYFAWFVLEGLIPCASLLMFSCLISCWFSSAFNTVLRRASLLWRRHTLKHSSGRLEARCCYLQESTQDLPRRTSRKRLEWEKGDVVGKYKVPFLLQVCHDIFCSYYLYFFTGHAERGCLFWWKSRLDNRKPSPLCSKLTLNHTQTFFQ